MLARIRIRVVSGAGARSQRHALLLTAILLLATLHTPVLQAEPPNHSDATSAPLPPFDTTTSLLVISPHPDDETLCCAGAMQRVLAAGGQVSVVWITSGDGSVLSMLLVEKTLSTSKAKVRELATRRMQEARAATSLLGVPGTHQFFLGYPDGALLEMFLANRASLHSARFTGVTHVPYSEALFPGHPYTGDSLEQDLEAVVERTHPTVILAPSFRDTHPDHFATGLFTNRLLIRRCETSKAHYWIIHGGEGWPSPREYMAGIPLNMPPTGKDLPLRSFTLTDAEQARKHQAIEAYRTQMSFMSPFLLAFARTSELYSPVPTPLDTAAPAASAPEPTLHHSTPLPVLPTALRGSSAAATDPTSDPTPPRSAPAAGQAMPAAASFCDSTPPIARSRLRTPRRQY